MGRKTAREGTHWKSLNKVPVVRIVVVRWRQERAAEARRVCGAVESQEEKSGIDEAY